MTAQPLNRPCGVDVLGHHARGMRAASEAKGITLTASACANLAKDLETIRAAVAELIEAARYVRRQAFVAGTESPIDQHCIMQLDAALVRIGERA